MPDPASTPGAAAPGDRSQTALVPLRDEKGRLLPGSRLNSGGRPKGLAARVRELVDFDKAIETLVEIAWGKLAPASRVADRIKAIELLFDRGHGKPQLSIDVKGSGAPARTFRGMPMAELVTTVEAMRALTSRSSDADIVDGEIVQ